MPEPEPKPKDGDPKPSIDLEAATKLASDAAAAAAKAAVASIPSPAPAGPPASDNEAKRAKVVADGMAKYEELANEGKHGEAMLHLTKTMEEAQRLAPQVDPATVPEYQSFRDTTLWRAKTQYADLYKRFGSEIDERINALSFRDQMRFGTVEKVIKDVQSAHATELTDEEIDARIAKAREEWEAQAAVPQNVPRPELGETEETDFHGLDAEQRALCANIGVSYKDYAAHQKAQESRRNRDGTVDILPRIPQGGTVQPGRF